jgi:hypothetical protein
MKEHFCPAEKSIITYQGKCNWCGEKEWVGLTIEEIAACCRESTTTQLSFAQELEAKLKEKNNEA